MKRIWVTVGVCLAAILLSVDGRAGSISFQRVQLERAAWVAKRIVVGKVIEKTTFRYPGSKDYAAQAPGQALHLFRIGVQKTLKGPAFPVGDELKVFSESEWFGHTHAELIKAGVMSYGETHYSGGIEASRIKPGVEIVFFLDDEPAPSGFPAGSVFMPFGEGYDRGDRAENVVTALKEGPYGAFDHLIDLNIGTRVRLPDHLEIKLLAHSHKRPMTGGPQRESTELELALDGKKEMLQLGHVKEADGRDSWDTATWKKYVLELKAMVYDERSTIVVRRK